MKTIRHTWRPSVPILQPTIQYSILLLLRPETNDPTIIQEISIAKDQGYI